MTAPSAAVYAAPTLSEIGSPSTRTELSKSADAISMVWDPSCIAIPTTEEALQGIHPLPLLEPWLVEEEEEEEGAPTSAWQMVGQVKTCTAPNPGLGSKVGSTGIVTS